MVLTREMIQCSINLMDISCSVYSTTFENDLYIMPQCDVSRVLWFQLLGLHLKSLSFSNPIDFLAAIIHANNKLGVITNIDDKFKIIVVATIILKHL